MITLQTQHYFSSTELSFWGWLWGFIDPWQSNAFCIKLVCNQFFAICYDTFKEQVISLL